MSERSATPGFRASRPNLAVDGRPVPGLADGLLSLAVEETTAGLFCCTATFGNWGTGPDGVGFLYFDRQVFDFGRALTVEMGADSTQAPVFEGRITALEGRYPRQQPPQLEVLAEDRCQDLRMVRRTRTFEDQSDHDVFTAIAGEHGLEPEIDVDGPTHKTLAQVNQSDLAFLRERARAIDAEVWVEGTKLFAQARARRKASTPVTLTYGQELRELTASADLANQRTRLAVGGWDVAGKEAIVEESGEEAISGELGGGLSGSSVLAGAFGERAERIVHTVPLSGEEARAEAAACYRAAARRFLTAEGIAEGDARIKVATQVTLQGLGPLFNGPWYVTGVRHTFDNKDGFKSRFCCERPGLGAS
jgi:Bacteriophage probable baseplate hub protein